MANNYRQFLVVCAGCGENTNRKFAAAHDGKCKSCVTGEPKRRAQLKPGQYFEDDGGEYKMSAEYAHEVRGGNDLSEDIGQSDY